MSGVKAAGRNLNSSKSPGLAKKVRRLNGYGFLEDSYILIQKLNVIQFLKKDFCLFL